MADSQQSQELDLQDCRPKVGPKNKAWHPSLPPLLNVKDFQASSSNSNMACRPNSAFSGPSTAPSLDILSDNDDMHFNDHIIHQIQDLINDRSSNSLLQQSSPKPDPLNTPAPSPLVSLTSYQNADFQLIYSNPSDTSPAPTQPRAIRVSTCVPTSAVSMRQQQQPRNKWPLRDRFGSEGSTFGSLNTPHGCCLSADDMTIVADTNNHRIHVFNNRGFYIYSFGTPGTEDRQLWFPRKLALLKVPLYVVCDKGNERSRMQLFDIRGCLVKKMNSKYIDIVAGMTVSSTGEIVAVDSVSPAVFFISSDGELQRWFECPKEIVNEPSDIAVTDSECFVCDFKGHCVVVFDMGGQCLRLIGKESTMQYPNGIDISDAGDVLVGDSHGNRFHVVVFDRDGSLIGNFKCPDADVSRCCGLNLNSEGYIVTLAKNNHGILVLNKLYINIKATQQQV